MNRDKTVRYACNVPNPTDQHVYSDIKSADDAEAGNIYTEPVHQVNSGKFISTNQNVVTNICKDNLKSRFKPYIWVFILAIFLSTVVSSGLTYAIMFLLGKMETHSTTGDGHVNPSGNTINLTVLGEMETNSTTGDRHENPSGNTLNLKETDINSFPRFHIYNTECLRGWYKYEDSCYNEFTEKKTWLHALDFCRIMDSDLLSIRDEKEANVISNKYLGSGLKYWIGLSDLDKNDRFGWSDRTDFNYENWGSGESNHFNGFEDCVELRSSATWSDANCYVSRNFVCKKQISTKCGQGSWFFYNKSCYMFNPVNSRMSALSWTGALQYCKARGADLAVTKSRNELFVLLGQAFKSSRSRTWIGLSNIEQKGEYKWADGTVPGTVYWGKGRPNNAIYGCANINEYGNFYDTYCDIKRRYICEKIA